MKKIFVVAIATSLVLANGASVAFADNGSGSNDGGSSTTVVAKLGNPLANAAAQEAARRAQEAARKAAQDAVRKPREDPSAKYRHDQITFRIELTKYLESRRTIEMTFRTAKVNAQRAFESARKLTTTRNARQIAERNFKVAVNTAQRIYRDSMDALGSPPVSPVRPEETK